MFAVDRAVFLIIVVTAFAVSTPGSFDDSTSTCQLNYTCCGTICFLRETNYNKTSCCICARIWNLGRIINTRGCHNLSCEMVESNTHDSADLLCDTKLTVGFERKRFRVPCLCTKKGRDSTITTEATVSTHIETTPHYTATRTSSKYTSVYFVPGVLFISAPLICIFLAVVRGVYSHRRSRMHAIDRQNPPRPVLVGSRDNSAFVFDLEATPRAPARGSIEDQPPSYDFVISADCARNFPAVSEDLIFGARDSSNVSTALPPAYDDVVADNDNEEELPSYEEATKDLDNQSASR